MSVDTTLNTNAEEVETTDVLDTREIQHEFVVRDLAVAGRTVDVMLVPFGEVATVADPPTYQEYREEWMPGVFDHQLNAANRIHAKYGHSESVVDVVGHGISLQRETAGYRVSTKIHQTVQGETALELLRDGALPCVSLEAYTPSGGSRRTKEGVVQRIKANLVGFAFCRQGAFAGAKVLAIREASEPVMDETLLPPAPDKELLERCAKAGIKLPASMEALLEEVFPSE